MSGSMDFGLADPPEPLPQQSLDRLDPGASERERGPDGRRSGP